MLPGANVRAAAYYMARTWAPCPHCGATTLLTAIAVGAGHEVRDDEAEGWGTVATHAFLFYIAAVSSSVRRRLRKHAPHFRFIVDHSADHSRWTNHCEHCGAVVDDDALHGEPGEHGFVPSNEEQAGKLSLFQIDEPFAARAAGYAPATEFFAGIRRL